MRTCDRCDREYEELQTIVVGQEHEVCEPCVDALTNDINYYDWRNRYTEEQHELAVSLLSEQDEIECVISSYEDGQIVVHTPYVNSDVVTDFCSRFGFQIISFGPQWAADQVWPCMSNHGNIFQIVLEYNSRSSVPEPTMIEFEREDIDRLDGNDKQF